MLAARTVQVLVLFTVLSMALSQMLGTCNKTFFHQEAAKCQRFALETVFKFNESCSSAYNRQSNCIEQHVARCLAGTPLASFSLWAAGLLKDVLFTCDKITPQVNDFLLTQLKCTASNAEAKLMFNRIPNCWTDMSTKLKANSRDPALCGLYREAKHCVSNETMRYCPNINVEKDWCNIFCANKTDDHRPCPATPMTIGCDNITVLYTKVKSCERTFITRLSENKQATACNVELPGYTACLKRQLTPCFYPYPDPSQLDTMTTLVTSSLLAKSFFCLATPMNVTKLSAKMKMYIPGCTNEFFAEAEKCAVKIRQEFTANRQDKKKLCGSYVEAQGCYYKALGQYCKYPEQAKQVVARDVFNPFCEGGKDPATAAGSAQGTRFLWTITFLSAFLQIF